MFTGWGGWGGRGESINFIRNNNQRKTKRHNCTSSHHSLNLRYNVKRSQLKQRLKKGGGESGVASSSLLHNPSDQYFFALSALNIEALHYREGNQSHVYQARNKLSTNLKVSFFNNIFWKLFQECCADVQMKWGKSIFYSLVGRRTKEIASIF